MNSRGIFVLLIVLSALGLVACNGGTPPGTFRKIDLRAQLPADVRARAPGDLDWGKFQTAQTQIKVGAPAATVTIAWRYFKDGTRAYLLDVSFQVVTPAEGVTLDAHTEGAPIFVGAVQAQRVVITWTRGSLLGAQSGAVGGMILADGRWDIAQ